jgi:hypothetical protein
MGDWCASRIRIVGVWCNRWWRFNTPLASVPRLVQPAEVTHGPSQSQMTSGYTKLIRSYTGDDGYRLYDHDRVRIGPVLAIEVFRPANQSADQPSSAENA